MKKNCIFIDAENRRITPHEVGEDYRDITKAIGCELMEVATYLPNGDVIYVDEEGRINGTKHYFVYDGNVFAGNGLVVGTGEEGETISCKTEELNLARKVEWADKGSLPTIVTEPRMEFREWK
jgi:hypothetical protein